MLYEVITPGSRAGKDGTVVAHDASGHDPAVPLRPGNRLDLPDAEAPSLGDSRRPEAVSQPGGFSLLRGRLRPGKHAARCREYLRGPGRRHPPGVFRRDIERRNVLPVPGDSDGIRNNFV